MTFVLRLRKTTLQRFDRCLATWVADLINRLLVGLI